VARDELLLRELLEDLGEPLRRMRNSSAMRLALTAPSPPWEAMKWIAISP